MLEVDGDFRTLIDEALTGEVAEVAQTQARTQRLFARLRILATAAAVVSLLVVSLLTVTLGLWTLRVRVKAPMKRLLQGVRTFAEGDMAHRIGLGRRDELSEVARAFDMMAERVVQNTARLSSENTELEAAVADRTQQLERLLSEARRAEANRRRMLSDVSHKLRTPLTIIKGEADVALRKAEKPPEAFREALSWTRDAARHTARLVDDLLFVSRSEEGHTLLKTEEFDLADLVADTARAFDPRVSVEIDGPAPMRGDPGRIAQALLVLLENARHHGGGQVAMRLGPTPSGWRVAVEDDGSGMSEEEKRGAFERF